jgi:hypothetical protein
VESNGALWVHFKQIRRSSSLEIFVAIVTVGSSLQDKAELFGLCKWGETTKEKNTRKIAARCTVLNYVSNDTL